MTAVGTKATIKDYQQLPEGSQYQLIDGEIITLPSPSVKHQKLVGHLYRKISDIVEKNDLGTLLLSPMDVYLDDENVVQPDLLFVSKANEVIIQENGIHGAPDAVIEIMFPDPIYYYHFKKRKLYEKHGVQEYWLIDPEDNEVIGYHRNKEGKLAETFRETDILTSTLMDCTVRL